MSLRHAKQLFENANAAAEQSRVESAVGSIARGLVEVVKALSDLEDQISEVKNDVSTTTEQVEEIEMKVRHISIALDEHFTDEESEEEDT